MTVGMLSRDQGLIADALVALQSKRFVMEMLPVIADSRGVFDPVRMIRLPSLA